MSCPTQKCGIFFSRHLLAIDISCTYKNHYEHETNIHIGKLYNKIDETKKKNTKQPPCVLDCKITGCVLHTKKKIHHMLAFVVNRVCDEKKKQQC